MWLLLLLLRLHLCVELVPVPARVAEALEVHHQHLRQAPQVKLLVSLRGSTSGQAAQRDSE
jgi:hypothetical protein